MSSHVVGQNTIENRLDRGLGLLAEEPCTVVGTGEFHHYDSSVPSEHTTLSYAVLRKE
jgi:hypothetical protein